MAISFVGAGTGTTETGVTSLVINKHASTAKDDLLLVVIAHRPNTVTVTPPAGGWKLVREQLDSTATASGLRAYWKVADGTEGTTFTFTLGASPTGSAAGCLTFRGAALMGPPYEIVAGQGTAAAATHATPSIQVPSDNTMIVAMLGFANHNTTTPPPAEGSDAAMDERVDVTPTTAAINCSVATCTHATATISGPKVFTDAGPDAADSGRTMILALQEGSPRGGNTRFPLYIAPRGRNAAFPARLTLRGLRPAIPPVGGAFELTLDPGAYVLTGIAATIVADRMISADPGSYVLTGVAATLVLGRVLTLDPGSYVVTGIDASLLAARMLSADPGSYTITGIAATIVAGRVISAEPGVYTLTGVDAILVHTAGGETYSLTLDPGSYTITGVAATLLANRMLSANPGVYTITGVSASVVADRILSAGPGTYIVSGVDASVVAGRVLSANPGSYLVTGNAAAFPYKLDADAGAYTIIGYETKADLLNLDEFPAGGGGAFVVILND